MSGINRVRKLQILYFSKKKTKTKKLKKKEKKCTHTLIIETTKVLAILFPKINQFIRDKIFISYGHMGIYP